MGEFIFLLGLLLLLLRLGVGRKKTAPKPVLPELPVEKIAAPPVKAKNAEKEPALAPKASIKRTWLAKAIISSEILNNRYTQ